MKPKDLEGRLGSPCIRRCCLDDDDVCLGCFRTMQEICAWSGASEEEREQVLKKADLRQRQHDKRWGQ